MTLQDNQTKKITVLGVLSALGAVLMILELPYPIVPFLRIDLSDVVVLVVFAMYGYREAFLVGLLKAIVHTLIIGPVGPMAIGQITALLASMSYVFGLYLSTNKLNLSKVMSIIVTIVSVTIIMTVLNYLFITPIWFGQTTFLDVQNWVTPGDFGVSMSGGYLTAISIVYVPFNIIKATIISVVFFVIYKVLLQSVDQDLSF
jgi:riboflavin transporter FmnP